MHRIVPKGRKRKSSRDRGSVAESAHRPDLQRLRLFADERRNNFGCTRQKVGFVQGNAMKKILIVAALMATTMLPATSVSAADMAAAAAAPKLSPACIFLPLLPDCLSAWKAKHDEMMSKAAPKTAMAAPKMMTPPTCTKAAAGAGHLYDCKM
jgi:hypothetical protein